MSAERGPAVAVIEDDDATRVALGRLLRAGGFTPVLFASAEAFIDSRPEEPLACLVVDVQLTGMSGIDLQRRLRSEGSATPVIITTGNRADVIRERAEQAGCIAFLPKPFCPDSLLAILAPLAAGPHT